MGSDRILVTGATGYVGLHLVSHVLSVDNRCVTLAVRDRGRCPPAWHENAQVRIVETGDIQTASNLDAALADVSDVLHLAGLAHAPHSLDEGPFMASNAVATQRLAQAAAAHEVRSFIHLSSLAAVTKNASSSLINDLSNDFDLTPFGRSKRDAENHVECLVPHGILAVSLRPPLVVGHDAKGNWAALQHMAATGFPLPFGRAVNMRSLVGVRSLVEALHRLVSEAWSPRYSGNYCLADDAPMSLIEIISTLRLGMEKPSRLLPLPPQALITLANMVGRGQLASGLLGSLMVDASRFHSTFDFHPTQRLTEAIQESGRLYRNNAISKRRAQ